MANAGEKRKLAIEPISAVCVVVLLIACAAVVAVDVNAKFIEKNETVVEYGDTITIDYTGSLYTYYTDTSGAKKPIIFDTTLESVGTNSDYLFTGSFSKSSYSTASVTLGAGKYLKAFEEALYGAKVGQTVKVKISAADAYVGVEDSQYATGFTYNRVVTMSATQFTEFFGESLTSTDGIRTLTDKNGMSVTAVRDGDKIQVTYDVAVDKEYVVSDSALGKVTLKVTEVNADNFKYTLTVADSIKTGKTLTVNGHSVSEIEMVTLDIFYNTHINVLGADGSNLVYNERAAGSSSDTTIYDQDLYFVIKVISKS